MQFSLSFLTERFNLQPQKYLKTTRGNSPYEYAAFTIVERYAKFTAHIILIWTKTIVNNYCDLPAGEYLI